MLQEGEVERIGSSTPAVVDVRVLAATNRDLKAAVASGRFREDLYYRLNVFPVRLPPLRERLEDLPMLVEYLVQRYAAKLGRRFRHVSRPTLDLLRSYSWPGNVRELQNVIERAVVLSDGDIFSVDESWLTGESQRVAAPAGRLGSTIADRERELIEAALTQSGGPNRRPVGRGRQARHSTADARFEDRLTRHRQAQVPKPLTFRATTLRNVLTRLTRPPSRSPRSSSRNPFAAVTLAVAEGKIQRVFFHADPTRLRSLGGSLLLDDTREWGDERAVTRKGAARSIL